MNNPEIEVMGMLDISSHDHSRRVHDPEGISPTVTAVQGGTHHIKIFDYTRYRVRKLTPTEYGRLQAFNVDGGWEQVVSDTQAYKQFGNAVTTTVAKTVARAIKNWLQALCGEEGSRIMDKNEFAQWIYENYTIGDNSMARELLENVLDQADGMEEAQQHEFLCRMIPQVPEKIIREVCY